MEDFSKRDQGMGAVRWLGFDLKQEAEEADVTYQRKRSLLRERLWTCLGRLEGGHDALLNGGISCCKVSENLCNLITR